MEKGFNDLPNWRFSVDEISMGIYKLEGRNNISGANLSLTGIDLDELLQEAKRIATDSDRRPEEWLLRTDQPHKLLRTIPKPRKHRREIFHAKMLRQNFSHHAPEIRRQRQVAPLVQLVFFQSWPSPVHASAL